MVPMDAQLLRNRSAHTLDRETAPAMWLVETLWLIQATGIQTNNRSTFLEQLMPRGLRPPTHRHPLAIEGFYVVEGVVSFHVDGNSVRAEAGTLIHLPRMVPHTFTVESEEARVMNFYAPAGSEIHVISLARPAEERRRPTMEEGPPPKNLETFGGRGLLRLRGQNLGPHSTHSDCTGGSSPPARTPKTTTTFSRLPFETGQECPPAFSEPTRRFMCLRAR